MKFYSAYGTLQKTLFSFMYINYFLIQHLSVPTVKSSFHTRTRVLVVYGITHAVLTLALLSCSIYKKYSSSVIFSHC